MEMQFSVISIKFDFTVFYTFRSTIYKQNKAKWAKNTALWDPLN